MYCKKSKVEFLKYCSLVKALTGFETTSNKSQSIFEYLTYDNEQIKDFHKNKFEIFCKTNLNLIENLDSSDKRFIEKGKNDFITFIVENSSSSNDDIRMKKIIFVRTISNFLKRNNIDNTHMIFQKMNQPTSTFDFIKSFSSFINSKCDTDKNIIAEKFFRKINSYTL